MWADDTQLTAPPGPPPSPKFEGVLGGRVDTIDNLNQDARPFLPYDPVIVEVGAYEGAGTAGLAEAYPYARIFACEPNPRAFAVLAERVRAFPHVRTVASAFGSWSGPATLSLGRGDQDREASLVPTGGPCARSVNVACRTLDEWCAHERIARVHFLRLDAGGLELQILQRARGVLARSLVVVTRTHLRPPSSAVVSYRTLRPFLEWAGFELVSHWYEDGREGEATFVRRDLYDSLFR
jgi:FkbM family methyltransferase